MSPIYDSLSTQHVLGQVPQGLAEETPYGVLAYLLARDPGRPRLAQLAAALAESHLDLYRVRSAIETRAKLEPLRGGPSLSVRLTGPFLRDGDRVLARVLSFGDQCFVADSPYC